MPDNENRKTANGKRSFPALVYYRSIFRYLLAAGLNRLWPRHFFSGVAPLKLARVNLAPPGPDWLVLKSRLCGICGSDLRLLKGVESLLLEPYASFPAVLGHEVVAEVVGAPPGSSFRPGDRVAVEPVLPCEVRGITPPCRFCVQGQYNLCENFTQGSLSPGTILGFHKEAGGGLAEFLPAHPSRLFRLPDNLPDEVAVLTDSLASALQPVLDHFPQDQDQVVIYGAGIIGQHLVRLLRVLGSKARIIMVARYPFQQQLAGDGGADLVLKSPDRAELGAAVGARLLSTTLGGGNLEGGSDLFFDCVGNRRSLQEGLLALRGGGAYVLVGTAGEVGPVDLSSLWFREIRMSGTAMYSYGNWQGQRVRTYQLAVDLLARGDYPIQGLISHVFPLSDYREAFQVAFDKRHHQSVKVVFDLR
ncbi:MAG: zinc-binding dehydrogenase [Deltaproteobacteria bacterium]|nr:zinc-binding dehydrogenase [Deltaproteobacteria bacterium]